MTKVTMLTPGGALNAGPYLAEVSTDPNLKHVAFVTTGKDGVTSTGWSDMDIKQLTYMIRCLQLMVDQAVLGCEVEF